MSCLLVPRSLRVQAANSAQRFFQLHILCSRGFKNLAPTQTVNLHREVRVLPSEPAIRTICNKSSYPACLRITCACRPEGGRNRLKLVYRPIAAFQKNFRIRTDCFRRASACLSNGLRHYYQVREAICIYLQKLLGSLDINGCERGCGLCVYSGMAGTMNAETKKRLES